MTLNYQPTTRNHAVPVSLVLRHRYVSIGAVVSPLAVAVLPKRLANRDGRRLGHDARRFCSLHCAHIIPTLLRLIPHLHVALVDRRLEVRVPLFL